MSLKNEIAALMASDGEFEKKVSLLKKAVVSLTKQKQKLEAQNRQLQNDMEGSRQELSHSREENLKLHRRVTTLENELDQERKRGSNFGQNFMKGLSSLVSGGEEVGGTAGSAQAGGKRSSGRTDGKAVALSPADVERVVQENEKLLMQVYAEKTKYDDLKTKTKKEHGKLKAELDKAARAAVEQRSLLQTTTQACDSLNADGARQRALVAFCQHFFALRVHAADDGSTVSVAIGPQDSQARDRPELSDDAAEELVRRALDSTCGRLSTLVDGVSVLLAALRATLPRAQRATVGDLRVFASRLETLQEAHGVERESLTYHIQQLKELINGTVPVSQDAESSPCAAALQCAGETVSGLQQWISLMRSHAALLVDCCVSCVPPGQAYALWTPSASRGDVSADSQAVEEREAFVEELAKNASAFLSAVSGALEALSMFLRSGLSSTVTSMAQPSSTSTHHLLAALLRFWWEGSEAATRLESASGYLANTIRNVGTASGSGPIKDALVYIASCVEVFGPSVSRAERRRLEPSSVGTPFEAQPRGVRGGAAYTECFGAPVLGGVTTHPSVLDSTSPLGVSNEDDLTHALAAADRMAVTYYTQMNATMLELAEKEDLLQETHEELQLVRGRLAESTLQAEQARSAFQEKIKALSDRLVEISARGPATARPS